MERVSLIDVSSSEDDLLASSSPMARLRPDPSSSENCDGEMYSVFEIDYAQKGEKPAKLSMQMDHIQVPELSDSPKQKPRTSAKYNLRKSLAWDNAFFTSEGVLDTEELGIVNSTFRKVEAHPLPCIEEDIHKSTESTTTLDSDTWALDNLEVDLFDNLRASIQKSFGRCDEASIKVHPSKSPQSGNLGGPRAGLSKKAEISSQKNVKPPVCLKRHGASKQQPDDTSKGGTACGNSKSLLKPPQAASRGNTLRTAPNKMISVSGRIQMKSEPKKAAAGNAGNQQSLENFKKINGDSSSLSSRPTPSAKPSSSCPVRHLVPTPVSSSYNSSVCSISNIGGKSPLKTATRRNDMIKVGHSSTSVNSKTSLRTSMSKLGPRKATNLSDSTKSTVVFSSSASPNSSVDSFASGASSSTSALKPSNSTESLGAISSSSSPSLAVEIDFDVPRGSELHKLSTDEPYIRNEDAGIILQFPGISETSSGTHVLAKLSSGSNAGSCIDNNAVTKLSKPSGLRLPSPKIGYFDAEKCLVRSANESSETTPHIIPRKRTSGLSNIPGASKLKSSKVSSLRSAIPNITVNSNSPHTRATRLASIGGMKPSSPTLVQLSTPAEVDVRKMENHDDSVLCRESNPVISAGELAGTPISGKSSLNPEKHPSLLHPNSKTATLLEEGPPNSVEKHYNLANDVTRPSYDIGEGGIPKQSSTKDHLEDATSNWKENLNPTIDDSLNASMMRVIEEKISNLCLSEKKVSTDDRDPQFPSNSGDSDSKEQKLGVV